MGSLTYTQLLTASGGIEADVTVSRLGSEDILLVTGTAFGVHELSWLRRQAESRAADVRITDVTGQYVCFGLFGPWGPARDMLGPLTPADLSQRRAALHDVAVDDDRRRPGPDRPADLRRRARLGDLRLHRVRRDPVEPAVGGRSPHGMRAAGYRAIDSLRLEKGYRVWAADLSGETTPDEAGLAFCVKPDKPGGFLGCGALARAAAVRPAAGLLDPRRSAGGGDRQRTRAGRRRSLVGRARLGGYGYTVGASIAYAYLPPERVEPGTEVAVEIFGSWIEGVVVAEPLYDPRSERVRR